MSAVLCIQNHLARSHNVEISDAHAEILWKATRLLLNKQGSPKIVKAAKEYAGGTLDTYEREILLDAMGRAMTGNSWPCFNDALNTTHLFHERVFTYLREMGAIIAEQDPYLAKVETLVEVEDGKGMYTRVQKRKSGLYDIARKIQGKPDFEYEIKHSDCQADDVIRALGHYLQF
jgi:hypothetical protein